MMRSLNNTNSPAGRPRADSHVGAAQTDSLFALPFRVDTKPLQTAVPAGSRFACSGLRASITIGNYTSKANQ